MFKLNQFNTAFVSEYKGKKSLDVGYVGSDGNPYPHKIQKTFGKNPEWKDSHFKIPFESEAQLKEFATWLMNEVNPPGTAEDSPF